ncbi:histidinol-phosphatase [Pseudomonas typographi]|uniref:Histidinol-phosphatase n=1 Tax=Pseudomonas typographi TaxID=2715964 RepID=A0ABR7Z1I7_9PSED|nr:histidinol-phosphatase [Pseudomonas typographi]MBD1551731.1 histidinol-phosphatase [Pseudomonas typographi]MBD1587014.1 histidinol-phosphatase [Pseudomonas typographi]MBD1599253.1 histidinol-phosphatase [Pseudomonas typographi]
MPLPLAELRAFAETLAQAAANAALPHFRTRHAVENKLEGGFDPVTLADKGAEQAMRALIHARYPEHGILGEEYGEEPGSSPLTWVLDPIDGTRAFITGLPLWGTLIALNDGTRPVLGVMSQPFTGERFVGSAEGAWLGEQRLHTRRCASLADAVLMSTSPQLFDIPSRKAVFDTLSGQARMTRYGGDCYAYCMLAMGLVDVVIEDNLKPYDVQALIPIIEAAGGCMTAWDGGTAQHGGAVVAAGDPVLHAWLLEQLRPAL